MGQLETFVLDIKHIQSRIRDLEADMAALQEAFTKIQNGGRDAT